MNAIREQVTEIIISPAIKRFLKAISNLSVTVLELDIALLFSVKFIKNVNLFHETVVNLYEIGEFLY